MPLRCALAPDKAATLHNLGKALRDSSTGSAPP